MRKCYLAVIAWAFFTLGTQQPPVGPFIPPSDFQPAVAMVGGFPTEEACWRRMDDIKAWILAHSGRELVTAACYSDQDIN